MSEAGPEAPHSGHRTLPYATDRRVEAWAPTREECVAEAVLGLVESFADTSRSRATGTFPFQVGGASDEDLLGAVVDEVLFLLDAAGEIPIDAEVEDVDGGLDVRLTLTDLLSVDLTGPVPGSGALQEISFGRGRDAAGGWRCRMLLVVPDADPALLEGTQPIG